MSVRGFFFQSIHSLVAFLDRRRGTLVVLLAVVLLLLGVTGGSLVRSPVLGPAVDAVTGGLFTVFSQPNRVARMMERPERDAAALMALQLELARLRESARETARFRDLLGVGSPPGFRAALGRVIGLDLDPLRGVAWISLGRADGLAGGESVMTVDGLAGVVDAVGGSTARVRLLLNEDAPVSVRDTRSRVLGIVEWDPGRNHLVMGKVPLQADVATGDTLVSSGLGGVFAPALPVGEIVTVENPPGRLLKDIFVRPFSQFYRLEEVFVLLPLDGPLFAPVDSALVEPESP